jgi:NAD(P)-dependent dehydrogenase (short-subunit alcohol dehydrogenase family)
VRILAEQHGGVDAVVTAAGIDLPGRLSDVPGEQWDQVIAVDLLGTVAVIRAALPYLVRSKGHVVTIASTLGLRALSDATAYCAAKFGVVGFTRALAAEMSGEVGVTLVVPGGMRTNFFDGRDPQYKPGADAQLNDPADVASTIIFAMSQPAGCSVRELVVCPSVEPSYP